VGLGGADGTKGAGRGRMDLLREVPARVGYGYPGGPRLSALRHPRRKRGDARHHPFVAEQKERCSMSVPYARAFRLRRATSVTGARQAAEHPFVNVSRITGFPAETATGGGL
jgi:hypothetical protein